MNTRWALLALFLALPAGAADWVRIEVPGEGDQYFYDRSKTFVNGDEITYWKKVVFRPPQPVKGQYAASGLYRERIHCAEHTLKLISYLLYSANGGTIEYVANSDSDAAPIIPDTLGDVFEKTACSLLRQKRDELRQKSAEPARPADTAPGATGSPAAAAPVVPAPSQAVPAAPEAKAPQAGIPPSAPVAPTLPAVDDKVDLTRPFAIP